MGLGGRAIGSGDDHGGQPAERRQAGVAPCLRFLAIETLEIAGKQRAQDRMLFLPGLHIGPARFFSAPRAAGNLVEKLKRALGGARVAIGQPDIGVNHADQGQVRESYGPWRPVACR